MNQRESFEMNGGTGGVKERVTNNAVDEVFQIDSTSRPNRHRVQRNFAPSQSFSQDQDGDDQVESLQSERQMQSTRKLLTSKLHIAQTKSIEIERIQVKPKRAHSNTKLSSQRRLIPLTISSLNNKTFSSNCSPLFPSPNIKSRKESAKIVKESNPLEEIKEMQLSEILFQSSSKSADSRKSRKSVQNDFQCLQRSFSQSSNLPSKNKKLDQDRSHQKSKNKRGAKQTAYKSRLTDNSQLIQYEDDESQTSEEDCNLPNYKSRDLSQKIVTEFTPSGQKVYASANPRFRNYTNHFKKLLSCQQIQTSHPVIMCMLTANTMRIMLILKESESTYHINQFDTKTLKLVFTETFGGKHDSYIKMNEIQQNDAGDLFAVSFIDNGIFKIRTFGLVTRTQQELEESEFQVNSHLGINSKCIPNHGNFEPFIVLRFVDNEKLFVSLFHNHSETHYHFYYSIPEKAIIGKFTQKRLESTKENLPQKCFLNAKSKQIYTFYRQGQAFNINQDDLEDFYLDKITEKDMGQIYLFDHTALISRSSQGIQFFKLTWDKYIEIERWKQYYHLDITGNIHIQKGTNELLIANTEKLYFLKLDYESHLPVLQNVINNFMNCSQLIFDQHNICLTYSTNKWGFQIRKRKYKHDIQVRVLNENLNKETGVTNQRMQSLLLTRKNTITVYDQHNFRSKFSFQVEPPSDVSDEDTQILSVQQCQNEIYLGVISGNMCAMNEQKALQLSIFKLEKQSDDKYHYIKKHDVALHKQDIFNQITMDFYFKIKKGTNKRDSVIIARLDQIIELNFVTNEVKLFYDIQKDLLRQPQHFLLNEAQDTFICASEKDLVYAKVFEDMEIDIDETYELDKSLAVVFDTDKDCFYIFCNKLRYQMGFYILEIHQDYPTEGRFIMKWNNQQELGDANIIIKRDEARQLKELIVSYKQSYGNTYNIIVLDVTNNCNIIFKHDGFHFWEQKIQGFLLSEYYDFVTISSQGLHLISLGMDDKRCIRDDNNQDLVAHSLDSYSFLKLDPNNCIFYSSKDHENTDIQIIQELKPKLQPKVNSEILQSQVQNDGSNFDIIYKVNVKRIQIRHLLLFQSIYICKSTHQIIKLVCEQPEPYIFYHALFELDGANMTSILSFENKSMSYLLNNKFIDSFPRDYPLFYKNKIQKGKIVFYGEKDSNGNFKQAKYFYRSALDNAIKNNQIKAIELIIEYIVRHQNVFTSSFLFKKNIYKIFEKGIEVKQLLDSNVFLMEIQFDQWPSIHTNPETILKAYNKSIFQLKEQYQSIFSEKRFEPLPGPSAGDGGEEREQQAVDRSKIFKIDYKLNLLPEIGTHVLMSTKNTKDGKSTTRGAGDMMESGEETSFYVNEHIQLMDFFTNSNEIDVFLSETVHQIIRFKWNNFAFQFHMIGFCSHIYFMTVLCIYVNSVYLHGHSDDSHSLFSFLLFLGIIYPIAYDSIQAHRQGLLDYLSDIWNYIDIMYNIMCMTLFIIHQAGDPLGHGTKAVLQMVLFLGMSKTFFFLRLFNKLSPIVTMLMNVIYDLRVFILFFMILILFFSLQLGVLGICNMNHDGMFRDYFYDQDINLHEEVIGYPGEEYKFIGMFFGNLFYIFRVALGDFSLVSASLYLDKNDNYFFWLQFFLVLVVTNIIFLNFLIAEAGNSYQQVQERLDQYILREKAKLIDEAENMIPKRLRKSEYYPKYLIIRQPSL